MILTVIESCVDGDDDDGNDSDGDRRADADQNVAEELPNCPHRCDCTEAQDEPTKRFVVVVIVAVAFDQRADPQQDGPTHEDDCVQHDSVEQLKAKLPDEVEYANDGGVCQDEADGVDVEPVEECI